jgi:hypothetical protein
LFGRSFSPAHYLLNGSDKSKIRLFNIASEKKQSFFAHVFGFTPFYFYIFIRKNRLGRKAAYKTNRSGCWCFPQGEKTFCTEQSYQTGRHLSSFFYVLSRMSPAITIDFFKLALGTNT